MSEGPSVLFCRHCLMPTTRPRIQFDKEGVCNACRNASLKKEIDWSERRVLLQNILGDHKSKNGKYDCVVPWSGGKDSSAIALKLKYELGLNPLLVTFSPLIPTTVGNHNREALINHGFDSISVRPNQNISRKLAKRFFIERGNPKVHWDAGINAIPMQIALNYDIPLVFYAEHGESEYGGHVLSEKHLMIRDLAEVLEHQIGDAPENWVADEIGLEDLYPYLYPESERLREKGTKALYFSYFFPWDVEENYKYVKDKIDFKLADGGRTCGTFTNYDSLDDKMDDLYYYMQFIKFGFGRCSRDASRMIYRNKMSRSEGLELCQKFEGEFPDNILLDVLDYMNIDKDYFIKIVDMHRESWMWEKDKMGWKLKYPLR